MSEVSKEHKSMFLECSATEPMSDDLIRDAVTVHNKVLSNAVCLQCIELCEAKYGLMSPFNGVKVFRILYRKPRFPIHT